MDLKDREFKIGDKVTLKKDMSYKGVVTKIFNDVCSVEVEWSYNRCIYLSEPQELIIDKEGIREDKLNILLTKD